MIDLSASPWLTVPEAAAYARRDRHTILDALGDHTLRGHRRGDRGRWRIHVDDLDAWIRGAIAEVQIEQSPRRAS